MKSLITLFLLLTLMTARSQELTADANTLLLLHFNNNTTGAAGETPVSSSNISYGVGKHGNALSVASNTTLRFDTTQNLKSTEGTIEFWVKLNTAGAAIGMEVLGGFTIELGNSMRLLQNVAGGFGNPEIALTASRSMIGAWHHLAFTWGQGNMKIYYDGVEIATRTYNFQLQPAPSQFFNIGSYLGGFNQMTGLLDELRISNKIRTSEEIGISYLMGLGGVTNLNVRNTNPIVLYKTWNLYLMKAGFYKVPSLYSLRGPGDTINIPNSLATWTVGNNSMAEINNGILTATGAGNTTLTATALGFQVGIPLQVLAPVREPDKPSSLDPFMTTPAECHSLSVPVLVIAYLPTNDGINMNLNETDPIPMPAQTVAYTKDFINMIIKNSKFAQEQSTKYRGYNNPNSKPYVGYKVVDIIYVYEPVPRGFPVPWNQGVFFNDYNQILPRFNTQRYVDDLGVKEVWVMGYHKGDLEPPESNMASPTTGDISNSSRFPDDMPVYSKTYIVYGHNVPVGPYGVGHIYGHQFEAMLSHVAQKQDGNPNLFIQNFVGRIGNNPPIGRCGDAHHPPNTTVDYDYDNATLVASDIMDWKPAGGTQTMVNRDTWGNLYPNAVWPTPDPNYTFISNPIERHVKWYLMWMQSYPGNGNQIPHGSRWMTNWWRFLADWDSNTVKIGLHHNLQEPLQNNCVPFISTGLSSTSACIGSSMAINYYSTNIAYNPGNIFTVELSNNTGSFNNPVSIGTLTGTSLNGTINVDLPSGAPPGDSYRMRVISSNPVLTSDASNILVINNSSLAAPVINSGSTTTFCTGGSVTLTSDASSGNQWYKDGVALTGSTGTILNVTTSGNYTARITMSGCPSGPSNTIVVTANPIPPTPAITAGSAITFCTGGSVTLTSNASSGNQWYKDGIAMAGSTGTTLIATTSGSYTTIVTSGGCQSVASNVLVVTVNPIPPTPSITQNGNQITSSAISGNQWLLNTVAIPGATNQNYTPLSSGSYTVQVTVNNCTSGFSNAVNFTVTGIQDLTNSQFFTTTQIAAGGIVDEVIAIRNVGSAPTSAQIEFTVTNYSLLTGLTVSQNLNPTVTIGFTNYILDNANWTFNPATGIFSSNTGIVMPPGTTRYIGVRITRAASPGQGANGSVTHTITITNGTGGGEIQVSNNSISNTLLKN
jgi:Concanavalin A-like lectin/glucanases superfamily